MFAMQTARPLSFSLFSIQLSPFFLLFSLLFSRSACLHLCLVVVAEHEEDDDDGGGDVEDFPHSPLFLSLFFLHICQEENEGGENASKGQREREMLMNNALRFSPLVNRLRNSTS